MGRNACKKKKCAILNLPKTGVILQRRSRYYKILMAILSFQHYIHVPICIIVPCFMELSIYWCILSNDSFEKETTSSYLIVKPSWKKELCAGSSNLAINQTALYKPSLTRSASKTGHYIYMRQLCEQRQCIAYVGITLLALTSWYICTTIQQDIEL